MVGFQRVVGVIVLLWLGFSSIAAAETSPAQAVQLFVDSVRKGHFAEAQSYLLDHVDVSSSLFGNWLFNRGGADSQAATADIFFSRKFAEVFRFAIIDTANNGEHQAFVTAKRVTPHMGHLYAWALAPQQNALPYTLVEAIDTYLTKVNYPIEESGVQFTLVRELEDWYISAIHDEKFKHLREQIVTQQPLSPIPSAVTTAPAAPAQPTAQPLATTTSANAGRQAADAQFQATLQGLNKVPPPTAAVAEPQEKPGFFSRVGRVFGVGRKKNDELLTTGTRTPAPTPPSSTPVAAASPPSPTQVAAAPSGTIQPMADGVLKQRLKMIRDALASYSGANQAVPDHAVIYDWDSLRKVVNFYSKRDLPATESAAGFRFVKYRPIGLDDYVLLVQANRENTGEARLEVTPYGVELAN